MKINIIDIPEDGMNLEVSAQADPWFQAVVVESFGGDYLKGAEAKLDVHLIRTGKNVQLTGGVLIDLKPACGRCLENFDRRLEVPLHINLAPRKDLSFGEDEEKELEPDDVNFSFYNGEEIDLDQIVREMTLLEIPLRYLCSEDCKGLCPQCGKNLNQETCSCKVKPVDSRFAALQKLKL